MQLQNCLQAAAIVFCLVLFTLIFSCTEVSHDRNEKLPKPAEASIDQVLQPVSSSVIANIKTVNPVEMELSQDVNATGYLDFDNRQKHNISALVSGRIEKLYIKYNYQLVRKGEKLFEIYSPELVTAQENLLYLIRNNDSDLAEDATRKLKLLGFTNNLLSHIVKTKQVMYAVPVFSPFSGHVIEMTNTSMDSNASEEFKSPELSVKEGMYVEKDKIIFNIANADRAVALLRIESQDISKIRQGQLVELKIEGDTVPVMGKVDFIEPVYSGYSRFLIARTDINNKMDKHKIGSLVHATLIGKKVASRWIPSKAVLDLGINKVVFLKHGGIFRVKKIQTGIRINEWIEVYDGLSTGSEIAADAHYLNDSESLVKIENNE